MRIKNFNIKDYQYLKGGIPFLYELIIKIYPCAILNHYAGIGYEIKIPKLYFRIVKSCAFIKKDYTEGKSGCFFNIIFDNYKEYCRNIINNIKDIESVFKIIKTIKNGKVFEASFIPYKQDKEILQLKGTYYNINIIEGKLLIMN